MSFESYENQQRLSLSCFAWEVIQQDMIAFKNDKFSNLINRIFSNFYPLAKSSIAYKMAQIENSLNETLETLIKKENKKSITIDVIKNILCSEEKRLIDMVHALLNGKKTSYISKVFRINEENLNYLCGHNTTDPRNILTICDEDRYYGAKKRKDYIECVIEEYCLLPYIERERIYFSSWINVVEYSIKNERQLDVEIDQQDRSGKNIIYRIRPYDIRSNTRQNANYLTGYDSDKSKTVSFRISTIKSVRSRSCSAHLYKSEKEYLESEIATKGVEYLAYDMANIIVKFSEEGIRLYNRISTSRPLCEDVLEPNKEISFKCTLRQAEIYFWKLKNSVEIIAPEQLRDRFNKMYDAGQALYH